MGKGRRQDGHVSARIQEHRHLSNHHVAHWVPNCDKCERGGRVMPFDIIFSHLAGSSVMVSLNSVARSGSARRGLMMRIGRPPGESGMTMYTVAFSGNCVA